MLAVDNQEIGIVEYLVEKGANLDIQDKVSLIMFAKFHLNFTFFLQ